jgi:hypothetical protein
MEGSQKTHRFSVREGERVLTDCPHIMYDFMWKVQPVPLTGSLT